MSFRLRAASLPLTRAVRAFWSFEGPAGGVHRGVRFLQAFAIDAA
jgi:hypothetical protein